MFLGPKLTQPKRRVALNYHFGRKGAGPMKQGSLENERGKVKIPTCLAWDPIMDI
jgi:hypothetical protein